MLSNEEKARMRTVQLVRNLNQIILKSCFDRAPHLIDSEVDVEPRHEAFWMCGGKFESAHRFV